MAIRCIIYDSNKVIIKAIAFTFSRLFIGWLHTTKNTASVFIKIADNS